MNRLTVFILFLFGFNIFAQDIDSVEIYFSNYEFQKVVKTLNSEKNLSASEYFLLAKSYKKLGQSKDASIAINTAIKMNGGNVSYLNFLGEHQLNEGEKVAAYGTYLKLCKLQPTNPYYYKKMGQALNNSFFESIRKEQILFANSDSLPQSEDEKDSIMAKFRATKLPAHVWAAYEKAIELNPNDVESKLSLIELYLKINNIAGADPLNKKSLNMHPDNEKFIMQAINISYRLRDYNDVVSKCNLYYNKADSNIVVQKLEGIAQFHLKNFEKSIELLTNVIEVDKDSEVLHYYLGLAYQEIGNNEDASNYLQKAIELGITENIGNYYTRLAIVEEELGNYKKSIQLYKAAYSETKDKILLYHLARNYDTFYKDKNTALKYYQLYLDEKDSSNMEYLEYSKDRVNELKVAKHFDLDSL